MWQNKSTLMVKKIDPTLIRYESYRKSYDIFKSVQLVSILFTINLLKHFTWRIGIGFSQLSKFFNAKNGIESKIFWPYMVTIVCFDETRNYAIFTYSSMTGKYKKFALFWQFNQNHLPFSGFIIPTKHRSTTYTYTF